jgi:hypothetical protein
VGVVDHRDLAPEARARGIQVRDDATGRESKRREAGEVEYGTEAKAAVSAKLTESAFSERDRTEVAAFLAAALRPNLTYDAQLTAERRVAAGSSVESVFTRIPRGKVIVRRGDEITPRTAQWIAAVRASAKDPSSWVKVTGILICESAAAAFADARRQRRRRRGQLRRRLRLRAGHRHPSRSSPGAACLAEAPRRAPRERVRLSQLRHPLRRGSDRRARRGWGRRTRRRRPSVGVGVRLVLSFPFALCSVVGSLAGIYGLGKLRARSVLLLMGGIVAAGNLVAIAAIHFLNAGPWGWEFLYDALAGIAGGLAVSMVVGLLLPIFEHLFSVVTDIRLLELSNQNLPLLGRRRPRRPEPTSTRCCWGPSPRRPPRRSARTRSSRASPATTTTSARPRCRTTSSRTSPRGTTATTGWSRR